MIEGMISASTFPSARSLSPAEPGAVSLVCGLPRPDPGCSCLVRGRRLAASFRRLRAWEAACGLSCRGLGPTRAQPRENEPDGLIEQPHGLRGVKIRAQETGLCKIQCLPRAVTFRAGVAGLRPETVSHQPQERGSQRWEQVPTPGFPRGPGDSAWAGAGRAGPTLSSGSKALRG